MVKKKYHTISNAYDAYWFLHQHPKFQRRHRNEITPEEAEVQEVQGFLITRDKGGKCYREYRHVRVPAIGENLDILYAKTDGKRVNKDHSKNKHIECWLEFGPVEYGYMGGGQYDWDTETGEMFYHDWRLDCGGPTFDAALIRLARLVRRVYGDYKPWVRHDHCGKPMCADCKHTDEVMKSIGLKSH